MSYRKWYDELNDICTAYLGLGLPHFEDMLTRDWYEDGMTPQEAFEDCVLVELEENGYNLSFLRDDEGNLIKKEQRQAS